MNSELESACWEVRNFLYVLQITGILEGKNAEQVAQVERELLRFAMQQRSIGEELGKTLGVRSERAFWIEKIQRISLS